MTALWAVVNDTVSLRHTQIRESANASHTVQSYQIGMSYSSSTLLGMQLLKVRLILHTFADAARGTVMKLCVYDHHFLEHNTAWYRAQYCSVRSQSSANNSHNYVVQSTRAAMWQSSVSLTWMMAHSHTAQAPANSRCLYQIATGW